MSLTDEEYRRALEEAARDIRFIEEESRGRAGSIDLDWAEFWYKGRIFISHTRRNTRFCVDHIVKPIDKSFGHETCFFLSGASAAGQIRNHYYAILAAFKFIKTVIVVISSDSMKSPWMHYETKWALEQSHPIILCVIDRSNRSALKAEFGWWRRFWYGHHFPMALIDFSKSPEAGTQRLLHLLQGQKFCPEPRLEASYALLTCELPSDRFNRWRKSRRT